MNEKAASQMNDSWKKMVDEHAARVASMVEEMGRLEARGLEQARGALDEAQKLVRTSLDYQAQLTAEWRKLAVETTRRAAEMILPRA